MTRGLRLARLAEATALQAIEREAGRRFAAWGWPDVAAAAPMPIESILRHVAGGLAWTWREEGRPVAFVLCRVEDGWLFVAELDVLTTFAGRGLGRRLLDRAQAAARAEKLAGTSLLTSSRVPWNAPYYRRLGFRVLAPPLPTGHAAAWEAQARAGLDMRQRLAMCRPHLCDNRGAGKP